MSRWTTVGEAAAYEKGYIEGKADVKAIAELSGACKAWNLVYELNKMRSEDFEECFNGRSATRVISMNYLDVLEQYEAGKAKKEALHDDEGGHDG